MRSTTSARGYGHQHQRTRREWAPFVEAGEVLCARGGRPVGPLELWGLGHVDGEMSRYAGPEHRGCNRATAGRRVRPQFVPPPPVLERPGLERLDERWRVPW